jgi:hypothetical protein
MAGGERESVWRDVLRRQATSRVSVAEFCRREGLSQPSFYAWRRTLAERDSVKRSKPASAEPSFLPVRLSEVVPRVEASIAIELAEGLVLRLPEATPAVRIAELVWALQETRR